MSDKVEIGDYVRTTEGYIFHIDNYKKEEALSFMDVQYGKVRKHNNKLIKLLEIGDFVNGHKVIEIENYIRLDNNMQQKIWRSEDIKSILTHEQYEANCFRVEG